MGVMPPYERKMATIGLLMLAGGVLVMARTGGKALKVFGFTVVTPRAAIFMVTVGIGLVGIALMMASPESGTTGMPPVGNWARGASHGA